MKSTRITAHIPSDGTGFKTRSMWLAEALGAQYSRRRGYHLAPTKHAAFLILDAQGWSASHKYWDSDKTPYTFSLNDGPEMSLNCALAVANVPSAINPATK